MKKHKAKSKQKNTPFFLIVSGGALLIIAALILLSQNSGITAATEPASLADSHEEETYPEIPRVSLEESKAALDEGAAVFLDVRNADMYAASHVPGALNIPLAELQSRLGELDKSGWIITYCT